MPLGLSELNNQKQKWDRDPLSRVLTEDEFSVVSNPVPGVVSDLMALLNGCFSQTPLVPIPLSFLSGRPSGLHKSAGKASLADHQRTRGRGG
jgi:hypothetical protein